MTRSIRRWWKRHNPFALWHQHTGLEAVNPLARHVVTYPDRPRVLIHRHPVYLSHPQDLAIAHPDVL